MQTFNYHVHTWRCGHSDQDYRDEEYVLDHIAAGFTEMAFTDHAPEKTPLDPRPGIRMDYSLKDDYLTSIKALRDKYAGKIRILSGFEGEYCPARRDEILELKDESDLFVLGQHYVDRPGRDEICSFLKNGCEKEDVIRYADMVEEAVKLGLPDVIAHPDVYLNYRTGEFTETDAETAHRVCRAAAEKDVPVEVNLHNILVYTYHRNKTYNDDPMEAQIDRLPDVCYPRREFWEIAVNYPLRVIYGVDVHFRHEIGLWQKTASLASKILGDDVMAKLNFVDHI